MDTSPNAISRTEDRIEIACACDARYLRHGAAMLQSVITTHAGRAVRVHLLHDQAVSGSAIRRLGSMFTGTTIELVPHEIPSSKVAGLPSAGPISVHMWYRILLPDLLPEVGRIIYLDIDVLVRTRLTELWHMDLRSCLLGAVTNVPQKHMLGRATDLGLAGADRYFNSGVLLMDLARMRGEQTPAALFECARQRVRTLVWPDQDALNIVLATRRLDLHPRWNLMNSIRLFPWGKDLIDPAQISEAIRDPAIVHFEGPAENKPWHLLCQHPYRSEYFRHRRQTPWPRTWPDGVTPASVARLTVRRTRSHLASASSRSTR